jgi:hypothetical protein
LGSDQPDRPVVRVLSKPPNDAIVPVLVRSRTIHLSSVPLWFQVKQQHTGLRIIGVQPSQFSRVCESSREVARTTSARDESDQDIPIGGMLPVDLLQQGVRLLGRTSAVQRNCIDIPIANIVWSQLRRAAQKRQRLSVVVLADQKQTKGMYDVRISRFDGHRLAQQLRALRVHATHPIKVSLIYKRGNEIRVKSQCSLILCFRVGWLLLPRTQQTQVEMCLQAAFVDGFRAEIHWGDETGLSNQANHGRSFAPRGRTPVVSWPAERFTYSMISTLTNLGTSRSVIYDGALNAVLFLKSCVG